MKYEAQHREALKTDLVKAFYDLLRSNPEKRIYDIYHMLRDVKAPRFYTSYELARRHISERINRKNQPIGKNKKAMYDEIYRRWLNRDNENIDKRYKYSSLHNILLEEAPSFYLSIETMKSLIYRTIRDKKKKKMKELKIRFMNDEETVKHLI